MSEAVDRDSQGEPTGKGAAIPPMLQDRPVVELTTEQKQGLEMTRQFLHVSASIASMSWGKSMTPYMRRAVTAYCDRHGIDPHTELDILGGTFYVTSEFYLRKLGEMRLRGIVKDFWLEHIQADERLKTIANDESVPQRIRDEAWNRWSKALFRRVEQNAPENAAAICCCFIELPSGGHPIIGCKWGGNQTSVKQFAQGGGAKPNPIVESNPELSVESQSIRRAMRQLQTHLTVVPDAPNFDAMEEELQQISEDAAAQASVQQARDARAGKESDYKVPALMATSGYEEPITTSAPMQREAVRVVDPSLAQSIASRLQEIPDPYAAEPAHDIAVVEDEVAAEREERAHGTAQQQAQSQDESAGPYVYPEPYECDLCKRTVRASNDHAPDCVRYCD